MALTNPHDGAPLLDAAHLARLQHLDGLWAHGGRLRRQANVANAAASPLATPQTGAAWDYDVALLGGGLSLLLAAGLATQGSRVVVIERALDSTPHREWNASAAELQALVRHGICSAAELDTLIVARYTHGICRWHGGGTQALSGVLDCAIDAAALWRLAYTRALAAGVTILRGVAVQAERACDAGVALSLVAAAPGVEAPRALMVGVVVDGRGAASPYATGDLVCPTVGGVLEGLEEGPGELQIDPQVGEILVTTEGVEDGRQHLWEAFPGQPGQTAVYLFYYAQPNQLGASPLAALYERFVAKMPRYKRGPWRLIKPTFGVIPGYSRLGPVPKSPHWRILLVGDAAGRQSPLTFCGFGAMLRAMPEVWRTVQLRLAAAPKGHHHGGVSLDAPIHGATGALALMLAHAKSHAEGATNALLQAAFATLDEAGPQIFAGLLQDTMTREQAVQFLWQVSKRHPGVWQSVVRQLGPVRATRWAWRMRRALPALWQASPKSNAMH